MQIASGHGSIKAQKLRGRVLLKSRSICETQWIDCVNPSRDLINRTISAAMTAYAMLKFLTWTESQ